MSKAIEYFEEMVECNQLDFGDEKPKCDLIINDLEFANTMKHKLKRWLELLKTDGCNSKLMVANDIQALLEEIEK